MPLLGSATAFTAFLLERIICLHSSRISSGKPSSRHWTRILSKIDDWYSSLSNESSRDAIKVCCIVLKYTNIGLVSSVSLPSFDPSIKLTLRIALPSTSSIDAFTGRPILSHTGAGNGGVSDSSIKCLAPAISMPIRALSRPTVGR